MRIRSFIIAYALVLAILLFADRRPGVNPQDRYSHVVDLTDGQSATVRGGAAEAATESKTRILAPAALIAGTWAAGQIPAERLIAPLVVLDLNAAAAAAADNSAQISPPQISLDNIAAWESHHGMIPQGAVVAIRQAGDVLRASRLSATLTTSALPLPITHEAAMFLMEARYTIGFAVETRVALSSDRTLARQLALHGDYVVEGTARFTSLPPTGSLVIVAPSKNKKPGEAPVRILAMVR
jgi:kynurenine formamidase